MRTHFEKLIRCKTVWLLFVTRDSYYILPTLQVKGPVGEFIEAKVREHGGKVR
jgi:hypothetical protein